MTSFIFRDKKPRTPEPIDYDPVVFGFLSGYLNQI